MPRGKPAELTTIKVATAIKRHHGLIHKAARSLQTSAKTFEAFVNADPFLTDLIAEERNLLVDQAEAVLWNRLRTNDFKAAQFVLSTIGKDRGYVPRQEVTGKDGGLVTFTLDLGRKIDGDEDHE